MIKNKGLFAEESLIDSKRLRKPLPALFAVKEPAKSTKKKIAKDQAKNPQSNKVKSDVRFRSFIQSKKNNTEFSSTSNNINYQDTILKELIINVTKKKRAPVTELRQYEQLLYFSRIKHKEKSEELFLKNKDTFLYNHNDNKITSREEIVKIANSWAYDKNRKGEDAISRHIVFSIGGKEDKDKVLALTSQFLKDVLGSKGFEYCYAPHYDTDNDHIHVIIKKRSKFNKNLTLYKKDLKQIRKKYNEYLALAGIKRSISNRLNNQQVLAKIANGQEHLKNNNSWYQSKLNKGNKKEFNAYLYKATLSGKIEEQINIVKIKYLLSELNIDDKNLLNAIKPLLKQKGIKKIHQALSAVKEAKTSKPIRSINGFVLKAIKDEYKPKKLINISKDTIHDLKQIKKDITDKENKEEILNILNNSIKSLASKDHQLAKNIESVFKDRSVRYAYVKPKKTIDVSKLIQTSKKEEKQHYIPDLTDYEIQEKFTDYIRQTSAISATGLETAISKAFAYPNTKQRFGSKKENEVLWHGEAGYIKSYKSGEYLSWGVNKIKEEGIKYKVLTSQELTEKIKKQEEETKIQQQEQIKKYESVAKECEEEFLKLSSTGNSPYLSKKGVDDIKIEGIKYNNDCLVIPIKDINNKIWSLQYIYPNSFKSIKKDSQQLGNFFTLTKNENQQLKSDNNYLFIAEGFATALTIYRATNQDTLFAVNASNMQNVTRNIKEKYPDKKIIIVADNDLKEELAKGNNPGLDKAREIKEEFPDIKIIYPEFNKEEAKRKLDEINKLNANKPQQEQKKIKLDSDFNDLQAKEGKEFVKNEIKRRLDFLGVKLKNNGFGMNF